MGTNPHSKALIFCNANENEKIYAFSYRNPSNSMCHSYTAFKFKHAYTNLSEKVIIRYNTDFTSFR